MSALSRVFSGLSRLLRVLLPGALLLPAFGTGVANAGYNGPPPPSERLDFYRNDGAVDACGTPRVLAQIQNRFLDRENEYWHSGLQIVAFGRIYAVLGLPHGSDSVGQRNCVANVLMNDHRKRDVHYAIIENYGTIGVLDEPYFCVTGLDIFSRDCNGFRP